MSARVGSRRQAILLAVFGVLLVLFLVRWRSSGSAPAEICTGVNHASIQLLTAASSASAVSRAQGSRQSAAEPPTAFGPIAAPGSLRKRRAQERCSAGSASDMRSSLHPGRSAKRTGVSRSALETVAGGAGDCGLRSHAERRGSSRSRAATSPARSLPEAQWNTTGRSPSDANSSSTWRSSTTPSAKTSAKRSARYDTGSTSTAREG